MKLSIKVGEITKQSTPSLIVGIYDNGQLCASLPKIHSAPETELNKLIKKEKFSAALAQVIPIYTSATHGYTPILLVGCGKKSDKPFSISNFRKIILSSIKAVNELKIEEAISFLTDLEVENTSLAWKIKFIAENVYTACYSFNQFKSEKPPAGALQELTLAISSQDNKKECEEALQQGIAIATGVTLTKNLANLPSNICTPTYLAEQAKSLAKQYAALSLEILEENDMRKLGMGAFLGVTQGTAENAKLICLDYKKGPKDQAPIVLIGKGITFDTGGISLKPADSMVGMKYDMCGAASVLGTLKAIAELQLPIHVIGIIAAAENMPGGAAYKPEDILTSMSGQTIEVISTDAEGRLLLCDALTYCERYKPKAVIDIATLTGAVVVALGHHATGLLANNEKLAEDLLHAGQESFDRAWQLPLWEEYQDLIKSPFADMVNAGSRSAGTITAGCFLSRFAKKFPWAHLDVAGTAAIMGGVNERMATGRPVPLLTQYLINQVSNKNTYAKN